VCGIISFTANVSTLGASWMKHGRPTRPVFTVFLSETFNLLGILLLNAGVDFSIQIAVDSKEINLWLFKLFFGLYLLQF
jgi:hypothetical protein